MRRILLTAVAAAFAATSAHAAPGFGGGSVSSGVVEKSETREPGLAKLFFSMFKLAAPGNAGARGSDASPSSKNYDQDCEDMENAKAEDAQERKTAHPTGPEPLYLAF